MTEPCLPMSALIEQRRDEAQGVFTLRLRLDDPAQQAAFRFAPGQFNMLYLFGVGEVPISIASDPRDHDHLEHTIRAVGRVTNGLAALGPGDRLGVRGPFGRGWPVEQARGLDLILITGGLGCAPVVSMIHYLMRRRPDYGRLFILQGVACADHLIWRSRFEAWGRQDDTQVLLAADQPCSNWPGRQGLVTDLLSDLEFDPERSLAMLCGPELMMLAAVGLLRERGLADERIWLSLERNMQCADGLCGHCQIGPRLVCRDGPVFPYPEIADFFGARGF